MSAKQEFARRLLELLWNNFANRVPYARSYTEMLAERNGTWINDHVAFRSLAVTAPDGTYLGITNVKRIFDALEFEERGCLDFPGQRLFARYLQHENPDFPKIFISELKVDELPDDAENLLRQAISSSRQTLSDAEVKQISTLQDGDTVSDDLVQWVFNFFKTVPWDAPLESTIMRVNQVSQYGAWTLLHGYNANHFTGYVNRHRAVGLNNIEGVVSELKGRGVPMLDHIEGAPGSKLRQATSAAVQVPVKVRGDDGEEKEIEWTYGFLELAQRNEVETEDGCRELFQGFLGPQASQLFDVTRLKG